MAENLYLFADNNEGVAENLGSYRLYDMKIEGTPEGVSSGVNYVDYLIGDGASYIDTGLYTKSNTKVEIRLSNISFITGKHFFGSDKFALGFHSAKGNWVFSKHGAGGVLNGMDSYINNDEIISIIMDMNDNQYVVDINNNKMEDNEYKYISNLDSSKTLKIFTSHYAGYGLVFDDKIQNRMSVFNLHSFKVYEGDNLVQDLKPCLDPQGIPCMYDEVSKKYFYNQGTGTFGYKKTLRDYQPVLDSNNIPCLLDKENKKYYYNKGTGTFGTKEKVNYRKLKYIQGDGDSWIDTGINIQNLDSWNIIAKYEKPTDETIQNILFGASPGGLDNSSKNVHFRYLYYDYYQGFSSVNNISEVDGVITQEFNGISNTSDDATIYLFAGNNKNQPLGTCDCRFYSFKIQYSSKILIDLIPVLDSNDIPCMYDLVSEQFFYNQGEGTFGYETEEADINDYTEIEYIESTGTQYIDTEVIPTTNTDIEMTCRACDYTDYISDGLVLNLDGINNTRKGHINDSQVWEDLSGNGLDFDLHNVTINDDSMYFTGDGTGASTYSYASIQNIDDWINICNNIENYTVEICMKIDGTESYQPIISAKPGMVDVAKSINRLNFKNTTNGYDLTPYISDGITQIFTVSCDMNNLTPYHNTIQQEITTDGVNIDAPNIDAFWIGIRLSGSYYAYRGYIYSIRIYNKQLTNAERLYNHSVDVKKFGIETTVTTCDVGKYILNGLAINSNTYQYNDTDTTVQPNLVASEGATLTMGTSNLNKLDEEDIEVATNNGWSLV